MASTLNLTRNIENGIITVEISLAGKDAADDALIKRFGDILVTPSGQFSDPNDPSYPTFYVLAGDPLFFFKEGKVRAIFDDLKLTYADRAKRAKLWEDSVTLYIQNELIKLRALTDTTTQSTNVTL